MEGYRRYFRDFKQWKIFGHRTVSVVAPSLIIVFCMAFVPVRAEETASMVSYEKTVTRTYSFGDGDIPIGIEYSEYDEKTDQEYTGTLYMTEGEMQTGFHFCAVYKGILNRAE